MIKFMVVAHTGHDGYCCGPSAVVALSQRKSPPVTHMYNSLPPHNLRPPVFAEDPHFPTRPQLLTGTYALLWAEPLDRPYQCPSAEVQTPCMYGLEVLTCNWP